MFHYRLHTNLLIGCVKVIVYLASAVNIVPSNTYVVPSPRIKTSSFSFSICTDDLMSAPKIMTFFPMLLFLNKNSERELNPLPR